MELERNDDATANETAVPVMPQQHGMRWVFVGEQGMRAGWSALIYVALVVLLFWLRHFLISNVFHVHVDKKAQLGPLFAFVGEMMNVAVMAIAIWIMSIIERRSVWVYGYSGSAKGARFLWGAGWGFAAISALVAVLWAGHVLTFDGGFLQGEIAWEYALAWGAVFLAVAFFEESLMRGYLQYTLTRGIGFWWAALIISILFGAVHGKNPGESPAGLFGAFAIALVFCLSIWYTGSLWWAVGFHAAWDWGESYFYGTSDSGLTTQGHLLTSHPSGAILWSGGTTGPEGSLAALPLVIVMAILMWVYWGRKRSGSPFAAAGQAPDFPAKISSSLKATQEQQSSS